MLNELLKKKEEEEKENKKVLKVLAVVGIVAAVAGIAYAVNQIVDLIANGVDGIHLYTMNNPYTARKICESIASIRDI